MYKILFIEDDAIVQFTFSKLLTFLDHEIVVASNGKEGLDKYIENCNYDFIICDINMPIMDGFEFFKKISINKKNVKNFIFISSHVTEEVLENATKLGVKCILKKPIDQNILKAILLAIGNKNKK